MMESRELEDKALPEEKPSKFGLGKPLGLDAVVSVAARDAVECDGDALQRLFLLLANGLRMRSCNSLLSRTKNPHACRHRLWYLLN